MRARRRTDVATGLVAVLAGGLAPAPAAAQETALVGTGPGWRYARGPDLPSPPVVWPSPAYDDGAWAQTATPIGYGAAVATALADMKHGYTTVGLRRTFTLADPTAVTRLLLRVGYDDGFVAYLNGGEIARRNAAGVPPAPTATATAKHEASPAETIDVSAHRGLLVAGANVLAVHGLNKSADSSDFFLAPELWSAGGAAPPPPPPPPPIPTPSPPPGSGGAPAAARGPYLQRGAPDGVRVLFTTATACVGRVEYGPGAPDAHRTGAAGTAHAIDLAALAPATEYAYRAGCDGQTAAAATHRFRTAPAGAAPFSFAVLGDSGSASDQQKAVAALIASWQPALVLHTGDIVYAPLPGGYDREFFPIYRELIARAVLYPAPGNHDTDPDGGAAFAAVFDTPANNPAGSERYYSFDHGDAHFVALDAQPLKPLDPNMLAWLAADLAATPRRWKFVFHHAPPFSTSRNGSDARARQALAPIYEQHGVDLVFAGHDHQYERTYPLRGGARVDGGADPDYGDPAGPIYVVTGGGGNQLYATGLRPIQPPVSVLARSVHHAVRVDVDGERLTLRAIAADGTVLDRLTLDKAPAPAPAERPPAPRGLVATAPEPNRVELRWSHDSPLESGFVVERRGPADADFARLTTQPLAADAVAFADTGAASATGYAYRVRARNALGESQPAGPVEVATPPLAPPAGLQAAPAPGGGIAVSWTPGPSAAVAYRVQRSNDGVSFALVAQTAPGASTTLDTAVTPGAGYAYRVAAFDAGGQSPFSAIVQAAAPSGAPGIDAPDDLAATARPGQELRSVRLTWRDDSAGEDGFLVERRVGPAGPWSRRGQTGRDATGFSDAVSEGNVYAYRVQAFRGAARSDYSDEASVTIGLRAPGSVRGEPRAGPAVRVRWSDLSAGEDGFEVERAPAEDPSGFGPVGATPPGRRELTDAAVAAGARYRYRVRAVKRATGVASTWSESPPVAAP